MWGSLGRNISLIIIFSSIKVKGAGYNMFKYVTLFTYAVEIGRQNKQKPPFVCMEGEDLKKLWSGSDRFDRCVQFLVIV